MLCRLRSIRGSFQLNRIYNRQLCFRYSSTLRVNAFGVYSERRVFSSNTDSYGAAVLDHDEEEILESIPEVGEGSGEIKSPILIFDTVWW
jgi:hypothetical protein